MLKLYKDLRNSYFIACFCGVLLALSGSFSFHYELKTAVVACLAWIILCAFYFNKKANNRLNAVHALRRNECRIKEYIDQYEQYSHLSLSGSLKNLVMMNLASGYIEIGEPQKGLELLNHVHLIQNNNTSMTHRLYLSNNKVAAYLAMNDLENAEKELEHFKKVLDDSKLKPHIKNSYCDFYERRYMDLSVKKGNGDEAIDYYQRMLIKETSQLGKAYMNYYLALAYDAKKMADNAKICYEAVVQNGGDSYYAAEAKKQLSLQ